MSSSVLYILYTIHNKYYFLGIYFTVVNSTLRTECSATTTTIHYTVLIIVLVVTVLVPKIFKYSIVVAAAPTTLYSSRSNRAILYIFHPSKFALIERKLPHFPPSLQFLSPKLPLSIDITSLSQLQYYYYASQLLMDYTTIFIDFFIVNLCLSLNFFCFVIFFFGVSYYFGD